MVAAEFIIEVVLSQHFPTRCLCICTAMSAIIVVIFVIKLIPVKAPPIGAVAIEMNRKLKPLGPYSVDTHLFFLVPFLSYQHLQGE